MNFRLFQKNQKKDFRNTLIGMAKKKLKDDPDVADDYKEYLLNLSSGRCPVCSRYLKVESVDFQGDHSLAIFQCGHRMNMASANERLGIKDSFRRGSVGESTVEASKFGATVPKEDEEIKTSHIFLQKVYPSYEKVWLNEQDSLVDTIALNGKDKILMQVTKLFTGSFWKELNAGGEVMIEDLDSGKIDKLANEAIARKEKFDPRQKEKIILLIDSWPGITKTHIPYVQQNSRDVIMQSGYKEVWIVGPVVELTYKLK